MPLKTQHIFWLAAMFFASSGLNAQNPGVLSPFAGGFTSPVTITHTGDSRLFVVDQPGSVFIVDSSGQVNPVPFLDITGRVTYLGEQGLLGLAFHPDYINNGYFYVYYIGAGDSSHISRFSMVPGDPAKADPQSEMKIMTIAQPYKNHNVGNLAFGADGYLYIGLGDGGSGGDPENRAQNPKELLGKILRIDVDHGIPYSVPESNPFYGLNSVRNDIWALGLRNPWRFSFAVISSNQDDSFFRMEDVMTGEEYLLYSPGMQTTLTEYKPLLWFNLIGFNGLCWQTFGLMIPFLALTADDIFFFATELNPNIDGEEALMEEVERNPIPFFMLVTASNKPVVTSRGYVTLTCQSTDNIPDLQVEKLGAGFEVTKKIDVYRLSLKKLQTFPHFAEAYYNQKTGELLRTSMTQHGFSMLTAALAKKGIHLSTEADIVVSPVMLYTAEKILNRKIVLNPYSQYFSSENEGAEENPDLSGINTFIGLALPFYNQGKEVDIDKLATQAGIDPSMAADLWQQVKKKTDEMRNKKY